MKKIILLTILLSLLFSCVYYNKFFNAKKIFKEAEEKREKNGAKTARADYNKVIKKCAFIVKEYKNNKYADDALFLLSKSLFYKGTNYTQAIDNFQQLIEFYPKSEFVTESKIFIARAKFKLKEKTKAYTLLENLLKSDIEEKYKSEILLLLSQFYFEDKEFLEAEKYLKELIEKYPKSKEYSEALVMLGNAYYEEKNFQKSLEIFTKIHKQKKFEKKIKLDALYFIALNNFELHKTEEALKQISKLMLIETRNSQIPKLRILNARILTQKGEYDKAIDIFKAVMKDNRRSLYSAEAAYRIAEIYFNHIKDYQKAIEYYNKVKTEKNTSEFNEDAMIKGAIASKIIQYYKPQKNIDPIKLINQQLTLAEYYYDVLDKPDSTLKIYKGIFAFKDTLQNKLDTLIVQLQKISAEIDSTDSLNYYKKKEDEKALQEKVENYKKTLNTYNSVIIPRIYFNKIWLYKKVYKDTSMAYSILDTLKTEFPENKFRYAAEEFLQGKEDIQFLTPKEKEDWQIYEDAIAKMDSLPQTAVGQLYKIVDTTDDVLKKKVKFALGYISYFSMKDTIRAKRYFDDVMDDLDYNSFIKKFYNGKKFTVLDSLYIPDTLIKEEDKKKDKDKDKNKSTNKENKDKNTKK